MATASARDVVSLAITRTWSPFSPSTDDAEDLVGEIAERCERWLARQGFGENDLHDDPDPDGAQMQLQAAHQTLGTLDSQRPMIVIVERR